MYIYIYKTHFKIINFKIAVVNFFVCIKFDILYMAKSYVLFIAEVF